MGAVMVSSALLFSADLRLTEVRRLLCSSRPLALHLNTLPELSDHDQLHEQQARLLLLCRRAMALPVGRGMFSLASASPRLTEALRMAPLVLKGRMPSTAATIDLDLSTLPPDQLHWPEFHNGTAAALRLCPPGCGESEEGELGRNWIVFNKPRPARQHAHAGFLLGLGLQGHLLALANTDLYRYMSKAMM
jgi:anaphase-promoting complex subunit 1